MLGKWAGNAGSISLLSRALALARTDVPWLSFTGASGEGLLVRIEDAQVPPDELHFRAGEVTLMAHVLDLLDTFIGEQLTMQLIKEAWPELGNEYPIDPMDPYP